MPGGRDFRSARAVRVQPRLGNATAGLPGTAGTGRTCSIDECLADDDEDYDEYELLDGPCPVCNLSLDD